MPCADKCHRRRPRRPPGIESDRECAGQRLAHGGSDSPAQLDRPVISCPHRRSWVRPGP